MSKNSVQSNIKCLQSYLVYMKWPKKKEKIEDQKEEIVEHSVTIKGMRRKLTFKRKTQ